MAAEDQEAAENPYAAKASDSAESNPKRPNLSKNPFLTSLNFSFAISSWPSILTLIARYRTLMPPCAALCNLLLSRQSIFSNFRACVNREYHPPCDVFLDELENVTGKVYGLVLVLDNLVVKVRQQIREIVERAGGEDGEGEVEVESVFVPGERVVFWHEGEGCEEALEAVERMVREQKKWFPRGVYD